jgi:HlyD family secretion protein
LDATEADLELDKAAAAVAEAEASMAESEAAVKLAKLDFENTTIRSPMRGVVIDRRVAAGQTVGPNPNAPGLFLIAKDCSKLQVWTSVDEVDVARVHVGQPVRFTVDAFPGKTFRGQVQQLRPNATMTQNVVTYTVVVSTDNADHKLLPYLTAKVMIEGEHHKHVLLVPNEALRWKPSMQKTAPEPRTTASSGRQKVVKDKHRGRVWIEEGTFVRPVVVSLGLSDGYRTEIQSDELREGMKVIVGDEATDSPDKPNKPKQFRSTPAAE